MAPEKAVSTGGDGPTFLMCPPDYYDIEYEINPWMSRRRQTHPERSRQQWQALYELLVALGARIELLEPVPGLPDLVFTANAGLVYENTVFLSRFRYAVRQRETPHHEKWFREHGFEVVTLPEGMYFEGAGDALFCGETLFAGYVIRSDIRAAQWIGQQINKRVIPLELVDPYYYHLDTCFCPLRPGMAMYYPEAFDEYGRKALQTHIETLIPVRPSEAARFACNAVVVNEHVVLNTGCINLENTLREYGFHSHATPLDEFIKAGGSAKCLTLQLR